jgi:hypothetical protein
LAAGQLPAIVQNFKAKEETVMARRVKAKGPKAAAGRSSRRRALAKVAPITVAAERRRLELKNADEVRRRVKEYKAAMAALERKGRGPKAARLGGPPPPAPLRILAEGDSWFDYPPFEFFGAGGVIPRLSKILGLPILNLATAGDEVRYMLGVKERKELIRHLKAGSPAGGPWDALFFSGGGNDIVDNPMALWVRDFRPGMPAAQLINQPRFEVALALVKAGYEDLIAVRNAHSPQTHLFFHTYDHAIPDGRGVCKRGPWLKPTFDLRGFPPGSGLAFEVVKEMLRQFAVMLKTLQNGGGVTVIDGQGTLDPVKASWHNELHPSKAGFQKFAVLFAQALKTQFPARAPAVPVP